MPTRPFKTVFRHVNKAPGRAHPTTAHGRARLSRPPRGSVAGPAGKGGLPPGRPNPTATPGAPSPAGEGTGIPPHTHTHLPRPGRGHPAAARSPVPALAFKEAARSRRPSPRARLPATGAPKRLCLPVGPRPPSEEEPGQENRKGRETGGGRNTATTVARPGEEVAGPPGLRGRRKGSVRGGIQGLPGWGADAPGEQGGPFIPARLPKEPPGKATGESDRAGERDPGADAVALSRCCPGAALTP